MKSRLLKKRQRPVYAECIREHTICKNIIVRFYTLQKGIIIKEADSIYFRRGMVLTNFVPHTDMKTWKIRKDYKP
jgi:hypothetical protein